MKKPKNFSGKFFKKGSCNFFEIFFWKIFLEMDGEPSPMFGHGGGRTLDAGLRR